MLQVGLQEGYNQALFLNCTLQCDYLLVQLIYFSFQLSLLSVRLDSLRVTSFNFLKLCYFCTDPTILTLEIPNLGSQPLHFHPGRFQLPFEALVQLPHLPQLPRQLLIPILLSLQIPFDRLHLPSKPHNLFLGLLKLPSILLQLLK